MKMYMSNEVAIEPFQEIFKFEHVVLVISFCLCKMKEETNRTSRTLPNGNGALLKFEVLTLPLSGWSEGLCGRHLGKEVKNVCRNSRPKPRA